MGRNIKYTVPPEYDGCKVIHYLRGEAKLSSRMVITLKNSPYGILLNGEHTRTVDRIKSGDLLEINIPDTESGIIPEDIPVDVIYSDDDLLVINKPSGLAMHPTHNHQGDTLANGVANFLAKQGKNSVFRAVGRLDKCTSGLVVCALNPLAAYSLSGNIKKCYIAMPSGRYEGQGTIDKKIYRPDPMKTLRAVGDTGDEAVTDWESVAAGDRCSVVKVYPRTGRTHQIRVHFASNGTPLIGDDMYGASTDLIDRAALHCAEISFIHPVTEREMTFSAPLPDDMISAAVKAGLTDFM